jgi:hypothetical protein
MLTDGRRKGDCRVPSGKVRLPLLYTYFESSSSGQEVTRLEVCIVALLGDKEAVKR